MPALPNPGGSDGTWGTELNDFLEVAHEVDGTILAASIIVTPVGTIASVDVQAALAEVASEAVSSVSALSSVYQPLDAELSALSGLTSAADTLPYFTGSGAASVTTFTAAGRALVDDANAAAMLVTLGAQPALLTENVQTDSYTLALGDAGLCVVINKGSGVTLTVPLNASVAFPTGTVVAIHQRGAGQITVAATGGVTINSPSSKLKLTGQYSSAALRKYGTDTWVLAGDIAA